MEIFFKEHFLHPSYVQIYIRLMRVQVIDFSLSEMTNGFHFFKTHIRQIHLEYTPVCLPNSSLKLDLQSHVAELKWCLCVSVLQDVITLQILFF